MRRILGSLAVAVVLAAPVTAWALNWGGMTGGLPSAGVAPSPWTMPHRAPAEASRPVPSAKAAPVRSDAPREGTMAGAGTDSGSAQVCSCPRSTP